MSDESKLLEWLYRIEASWWPEAVGVLLGVLLAVAILWRYA